MPGASLQRVSPAVQRHRAPYRPSTAQQGADMHIESSVTSVSWIPSEAVSGLTKVGFTAGIVHYDDPPPDAITDLAGLHAAERFRFANHLAAWIDVQDGNVADAGYSGRGYITRTRLRAGSLPEVTFQPAEFPELKATPEISATGARFTQTTGGRTGRRSPAGQRQAILSVSGTNRVDHPGAYHRHRRDFPRGDD